jgi:hypothetical protein
MGLHQGYIVATSSQADLFEELSRHAGELTVHTVVERCEDAELDSGEFDLMIGELDGRAFLIDTSMFLSDSPDMIVAMSAKLGTVIGCGGETVSWSFWLTAARDGIPLRYVSLSPAATKGMAMGDPLPSEDEYPLEDITGRGVFAAMACFGLDPSPWLDSGPATVIKYNDQRGPQSGPIEAIRRKHYERYGRTDDNGLGEIKAVIRNPSP